MKAHGFRVELLDDLVRTRDLDVARAGNRAVLGMRYRVMHMGRRAL
jgi:hypothetical protein